LIRVRACSSEGEARANKLGAFRDRCFFVLVAIAFIGCEKPPHGLSRDQIEQTIKDHGESLKSCWKASGPHGELKLRVAITTSAAGHVESAVADGKDVAVNACVEKRVKGWTFAKAEDATKFSLPVNLKR
jgi:hypothetical protein